MWEYVKTGTNWLLHQRGKCPAFASLNVQSALNMYQSQCSRSRDDRWRATVYSRTSLWGFSISGLLVRLVLHRIVSNEVLAGTEIPGDTRRRGGGR